MSEVVITCGATSLAARARAFTVLSLRRVYVFAALLVQSVRVALVTLPGLRVVVAFLILAVARVLALLVVAAVLLALLLALLVAALLSLILLVLTLAIGVVGWHEVLLELKGWRRSCADQTHVHTAMHVPAAVCRT